MSEDATATRYGTGKDNRNWIFHIHYTLRWGLLGLETCSVICKPSSWSRSRDEYQRRTHGAIFRHLDGLLFAVYLASSKSQPWLDPEHSNPTVHGLSTIFDEETF